MAPRAGKVFNAASGMGAEVIGALPVTPGSSLSERWAGTRRRGYPVRQQRGRRKQRPKRRRGIRHPRRELLAGGPAAGGRRRRRRRPRATQARFTTTGVAPGGTPTFSRRDGARAPLAPVGKAYPAAVAAGRARPRRAARPDQPGWSHRAAAASTSPLAAPQRARLASAETAAMAGGGGRQRLLRRGRRRRCVFQPRGLLRRGRRRRRGGQLAGSAADASVSDGVASPRRRDRRRGDHRLLRRGSRSRRRSAARRPRVVGPGVERQPRAVGCGRLGRPVVHRGQRRHRDQRGPRRGAARSTPPVLRAGAPSGYTLTYTGGAYTVTRAGPGDHLHRTRLRHRAAARRRSTAGRRRLRQPGQRLGELVVGLAGLHRGRRRPSPTPAPGPRGVDANQPATPSARPRRSPRTIAVQAAARPPASRRRLPAARPAATRRLRRPVHPATGTPGPSFCTSSAGAPSWLAINPATGTVTGTPPAPIGTAAPSPPRDSARDRDRRPSPATRSDKADRRPRSRPSCPDRSAAAPAPAMTITDDGLAQATKATAGAVVPTLKVSGAPRTAGASAACSAGPSARCRPGSPTPSPSA